MNIQKIKNHFVITRGGRPEYFCFYVDATSVCWSKFADSAQQFATEQDAKEAIERIKERDTRRRRQRQVKRFV